MSEPGPPDDPGEADEPEAVTPPALIAWRSSNSLPPPPPDSAAPATHPPPPSSASPPSLGAPPPSAPWTASSPVHTARAPRKRWIVALASVLVATALLAAAGTALFFTNTYPPLRVAYDFVDDMNEGRTTDAYARLCDQRPGEQRATFESFGIARDAAESMSVDLFSVDRDGDNAIVDVTVNGGEEFTFTIPLPLIHEDGEWRVCFGRPSE